MDSFDEEYERQCKLVDKHGFLPKEASTIRVVSTRKKKKANPPKLTKDEYKDRNDMIIRLRESGLTMMSIAKEFGISAARVSQISRYHSIN